MENKNSQLVQNVVVKVFIRERNLTHYYMHTQKIKIN